MKTSWTSTEIGKALGQTARGIRQRAKKEDWPYRTGHGKGRGGCFKEYELEGLPIEIQQKLIGGVIELHLSTFTEAGSVISAQKTLPSADILSDPKIKRWLAAIQEVADIPPGHRRRSWVEKVAQKHNTTWQNHYKVMRKYEDQGLSGLEGRRSDRDKAKIWTAEALDFWLGLCFKREHRKISKKALYNVLKSEAIKQGWEIGSLKSAYRWFRKKAIPQFTALQRGGLRALDNSLPPVLRDYSDLEPFEMLVGDQHRFDFWVTDDDTGAVFRPEGYFWQDLRTRCFYGGALDKRYDAYLMGLALRMGMLIFGPFGSIYSDHGKPEESNYIENIQKTMREYGLFAERTVDMPVDLAGADGEEINPCILMPGTHIKAIVRNAKAKMIEGTFRALEGILRNELRLPGNVKDLAGPQEENEVDQKDIARLAATGKLLTFREFCVAVLKAMDHYNSRKPHRGVRREWHHGNPPVQSTPMDCLRACHTNGWRPVYVSDEAVDLLFLPKATRSVDRGRITWKGIPYEHAALVELENGTRVPFLHDPMDPGWLLVFSGGEFICRAEPAEYSSMKDKTLAGRKIEEKRRLRRKYIEQYRELTAPVPDFRRYSEVPAAERVAAQIGAAKKQRIAEQQELARVWTKEELEEGIRKLEARTEEIQGRKLEKSIPERPTYFLSDFERYKWIVDFELVGGSLGEEDEVFREAYSTRMDDGEREHWQVIRELGGS